MRLRTAALALVAWTGFSWIGRVRNVLDAGEGAGSLVVPVVLLLLAAWALADLRRGTAALAVATIAVWVVRVPLVLLHDHPLSFDVVHVVLAAVSIGLAVTALRALDAERRPASAGV